MFPVIPSLIIEETSIWNGCFKNHTGGARIHISFQNSAGEQVSRCYHMNDMFELLNMGFLNFKSPYILFTTDGNEQKKIEVRYNLIGLG